MVSITLLLSPSVPLIPIPSIAIQLLSIIVSNIKVLELPVSHNAGSTNEALSTGDKGSLAWWVSAKSLLVLC